LPSMHNFILFSCTNLFSSWQLFVFYPVSWWWSRILCLRFEWWNIWL